MISKLKSYYEHYRWSQRYKIKKHIESVQKLYADCDGFELSRQEQSQQPNLSLTYGEIQLESFLALLSLAKPSSQQVFYELGAGLGKTVIAASNTYQFKKAYGIETVESLHRVAKQKLVMTANARIEFIHDNFLNTNWADADMIFLNVASFVPDTWHLICDKLISSPAPTIITCSKPLPKAYFDIQETKVLCSWGVVPAYIHRYTKNTYAQT